jgi:hypothetical protein
MGYAGRQGVDSNPIGGHERVNKELAAWLMTELKAVA